MIKVSKLGVLFVLLVKNWINYKFIIIIKDRVFELYVVCVCGGGVCLCVDVYMIVCVLGKKVRRYFLRIVYFIVF